MSTSESEYDLVVYGTPLEPLEEDEIPTKKPRLLEDQIVTDKEGRRRFHGAFTGGFSAGFFNTVGSLEGWTPSSFKSSKSQKQDILKQKPEDFMDEEDLSEFGISPVVLKAKQDYTNENKTKSTHFSRHPTLGSYVQDLLKPARETIGIKLLKKMGWKPGQGVGPRISKKEKENIFKMRQKTYGCQLPPGILEENEECDQNSDSEWDDIEFAPSDYEPFLCEAKNNIFGLGYEGLDKRPVLSENLLKKGDEGINSKNKKPNFSSQAFGVGAFEEEDEDIYAKEDMSRYDFSLGNDQSADVNKSTGKNSFATQNVLEGFEPEAKKRIQKIYELPVLPKNFTPSPMGRVLCFDEPSVSDKEKDEKEIKIISSGKISQLSEKDVETKKQKEKLTMDLISNVKIKESRFKPFSSTPDKQERYENYLKLIKIGKPEQLSNLQPLLMTLYNKEREKEEFEKAAQLFKPLSEEMEDRFLSASQSDDLSDPLAIVEKYVDEKDDRVKAAKSNMFGPLTRSTKEWFPSSLLCKRFNIPEPKISHTESTEKKKPKISFNLFDAILSSKKEKEEAENMKKSENTKKVEIFKKSENMKKVEEDSTPGKANQDEAKKTKKPEENSTHGKTDQGEPEMTELKGDKLNEIQDKTDLFKAIFLASDDDEDPNKEEDAEVKKSKEGGFGSGLEASEHIDSDLLFEEKLINSKRNLSPPTGLFKNLDLDLLSGRKTVTKKVEEKKIKSVIEGVKTKSPSPDLSCKPEVPENYRAIPKHSTDDGVWVEKKTHVKKKHKKKDKKHKKDLHKSKHKHKKHKR